MEESLRSFINFRKNLCLSFKNYSDANMNLLDSLSSNLSAKSLAQLTLNSEYKRKYTSAYKSVAKLEYRDDMSMPSIASELVPSPEKRSFHMMALDVTPAKAVYSKKKGDRTPVYSPTKIPGQKPITVGHKYSFVVSLPEKKDTSPPWVLPLDVKRVKSSKKDHEVGADQIQELLKNQRLPYGKELTMVLGDTSYGSKQFLKKLESDLKKTACHGKDQRITGSV